ncbi:MAG: beta-ketoacyl-[acyl-carrier-protein] synthase family protein [Candidatus Cryptobacteroides sp.]
MTEVFVTGLGVVSSIGTGVQENLAALRAGRSGISKSHSLRTRLDVPLAEVPLCRDASLCNDAHSPQPLPDGEDPVTRTALLSCLAVREALEDAGINPSELPVGLILGTSVGGMDLGEIFYEDFSKDSSSGDIRLMRHYDCGASTDYVRRKLSLTGYGTTISTACSSAGNAIMLGARMICAGLADVVVAGGGDALSRFTVNGFNSLRILSSSSCRPFDVSRDGLNLGEGAGFLVLESGKSLRERGVEPYCRISGWANVDEAFHQTGSSPEGDGAFAAMSAALDVAGLEPSDIGYVNTHGTATPGNDLSEGNALKRLFGEKLPPFGSFKGYVGHTLAASEGIEAVYCVLSLKYGELWPSLGFTAVDPLVGVEPLTAHRTGLRIENILSNSFGFGGNDSSLVFSSL